MIDFIFCDVLSQTEKYPFGFWNNYAHREFAASHCHSKMDYKEKFPSAYNKSLRVGNGEIDKFAALFFDKKTTYPKGHWNSFEHRLNAAKQCKCQHEYLEKFPGAYSKSALIKGEMQYFRDNVFVQNPTPKNYWTDYKRREEAASKCHSKTEYAQKYPVAYRNSRKNMNEFNDFVNRFFTNSIVDDESKIYLIYVYLNYDLMIGYCGLTRQTINMRHSQHKQKDDRLYKLFVEKYHVELPIPIVIKEHLNRVEAQQAEDDYLHYYKKEGFNMLNAGHTGKNIGSIGYIFKYNKERCLECAKKCTSIKQFRKEYKKEYISAKNNNWLNDYDWLEQEKFKKDVTYEECKELAKTCKSISEFQKKYPSEVIIARKNKWLYDFFGTPVSWSYDVCYNEAKKYKTRTEFKKNCHGAYVASLNNKWLDSFTWLKYKKQNKRTFENIFKEVLKYKTTKEIFENDNSLYYVLSKRNLFDLFFDKSGDIKEYLYQIDENSEEYIKLKTIAEKNINNFLINYNQKRKNEKDKT